MALFKSSMRMSAMGLLAELRTFPEMLDSRHPHRHPELVSGPIMPGQPKPRGAKWALKQVQGDGSSTGGSLLRSGEFQASKPLSFRGGVGVGSNGRPFWLRQRLRAAIVPSPYRGLFGLEVRPVLCSRAISAPGAHRLASTAARATRVHGGLSTRFRAGPRGLASLRIRRQPAGKTRTVLRVRSGSRRRTAGA
jgi:hypothetical protein